MVSEMRVLFLYFHTHAEQVCVLHVLAFVIDINAATFRKFIWLIMHI